MPTTNVNETGEIEIKISEVIQTIFRICEKIGSDNKVTFSDFLRILDETYISASTLFGQKFIDAYMTYATEVEKKYEEMSKIEKQPEEEKKAA